MSACAFGAVPPNSPFGASPFHSKLGNPISSEHNGKNTNEYINIDFPVKDKIIELEDKIYQNNNKFDELEYKINENNDKIDKFNELEDKLNNKIDKFTSSFNEDFDDDVIDMVNNKFCQLEDKLNNKYNQLHNKLNKKFNTLEEKLNSKYNNLEEKYIRLLDIVYYKNEIYDYKQMKDSKNELHKEFKRVYRLIKSNIGFNLSN